MSDEFDRYSPKEVLQIMKDLYLFQSEYCNEVDCGYELSFQTTIKSWRDACNLLKPGKLAKDHHEFFGLTTDLSELENILRNEKENTLNEYCNYIARNAIKEKIPFGISLGGKCQETGIFKKLKEKLEKKGINIKELKPSNNFPFLFKKYPSEIVEIVSKLAPGTISYYNIEENKISKTGGYLLLIACIVLIIALVSGNVSFYLFIPFGIAITILIIENKIKYRTFEIGGFKTIKDLVIGVKNNLEK